MKTSRPVGSLLWVGVLLSLWLLAASGLAQSSNRLDSSLNRMSMSGVEDTSKLKLLAERGYVDAQLKIAKECMANRLYADALKWYSAAADQGVMEARYQKGHMLLFGCDGTTPEQTVVAKPSEGLRFTYMAATNRNYAACFDMARALKDGIGCPADPVAAYTWFSLCADAGDKYSREAMNGLALRLSTDDIRLALTASRELKAGHWPDLSVQAAAHHAAVQVAIKLKLSGVIYSPRGNTAVINNRTLGEGESSQFPTDQKGMVTVTCQRILTDYVEVQVEGEAQPRTLVPGQH